MQLISKYIHPGECIFLFATHTIQTIKRTYPDKIQNHPSHMNQYPYSDRIISMLAKNDK